MFLTCHAKKSKVPKFQPLVQEEYPKESPAEILQRLVKMWGLHVKEMAFGTRCTKTCACREEGWALVFRCGDVFRETQPPPSMARKSATQSRVPRKVIRGDSADLAMGGTAQKTATGAQPAMSLLPATISEGTVRGGAGNKHIAPCSSPYRKSVNYDTRSPLGFYCQTRKLNGKTTCVLTSISPGGQTQQKDPTVRAGAIGKPRSVAGTTLL